MSLRKKKEEKKNRERERENNNENNNNNNNNNNNLLLLVRDPQHAVLGRLFVPHLKVGESLRYGVHCYI